MLAIDILEQKRYEFSELSKKFKLNDENTTSILKRLKEYGVLKTVKSSNEQRELSELSEEDVESIGVEKENYYYVFTYVGVLIVSNIVLKCYPKYLKNSNNMDINKELKQVIKIIKKYNSKEQKIYMQNEINDNSAFNMLSIMIYFIDDYYNNGLYSNYQNIIESNGSGEILWDKTINETFALIHNNRPYYTEFFTKKSIQDDRDYFKLLHEVILTKCSNELKNVGILELFDLTPVNINNQDLDDFGEKEFILYRIKQELNIQFNSHKQALLNAMYAYISNSNSYLGNLNYFSMYGTTSYNLIWEDICCSVLNDKKNTELSNMDLPKKLNPQYDGSNNLLSVIDKPKWELFDEKYKKSRAYVRTWEPDLLTFYNENDKYIFAIFDAKYYNLEETRPGIDSITKQHLYELAYKKFIELHGFDDIKNCFLLPTTEEEIIKEGYVTLEILSNVKKIQIRLLPVKIMNKLYLENGKLDPSELEL